MLDKMQPTRTINESSLSRVVHHMEKHDCGTITAHRAKEGCGGPDEVPGHAGLGHLQVPAALQGLEGREGAHRQEHLHVRAVPRGGHQGRVRGRRPVRLHLLRRHQEPPHPQHLQAEAQTLRER